MRTRSYETGLVQMAVSIPHVISIWDVDIWSSGPVLSKFMGAFWCRIRIFNLFADSCHSSNAKKVTLL